jgi:hemerythrin-like domain-containing protein
MTATEILKHEHRLILQVLAAAGRIVSAIQNTGKLDAARVGKMLAFFQTFVEACHNAKEEEYVFPRVQERGSQEEKNLIADLLGDHDMGRRLVQAMGEALGAAGSPAAPARLAEDLTAYGRLLKDHIDREDHVLFPRLEALFTGKDQEQVLASFARHEAEEIGAGVHEKYEKLAQELAEGL